MEAVFFFVVTSDEGCYAGLCPSLRVLLSIFSTSVPYFAFSLSPAALIVRQSDVRKWSSNSKCSTASSTGSSSPLPPWIAHVHHPSHSLGPRPPSLPFCVQRTLHEKVVEVCVHQALALAVRISTLVDSPEILFETNNTGADLVRIDLTRLLT